MESIIDAKIKIDKDLISIEAEQTTSDEVETLVKEMSDLLEAKLTEMKKVDADRSLFSLSRTVKELAPYPPPFSGNAKDNVYRFTKKMKEAIEANQVRVRG